MMAPICTDQYSGFYLKICPREQGEANWKNLDMMVKDVTTRRSGCTSMCVCVCVCVCAGFIHNFEFWEGGNSQVRCDVEGVYST